MRPLPAKKLARILEAHGFILSRRSGSHAIYRQTASGIVVPIPFHGGNHPIPIGTFLAIVKQAKLPKELFK